MNYRQQPRQHQRMPSRNDGNHLVPASSHQTASSQSYQTSQPYPTVPTSPYSYPAAPAMQYTSSSGSDRSMYSASSMSSTSSPQMSPSNYPSTSRQGSVYSYTGSTPMSPSASRQSNERSSDRYICLFKSCDATFSRPADLSRHQVSVHLREYHLMDCPKPRCSRKGDNGFSRRDHLMEHLSQYHHENVEKSRAQRTSSVRHS